ncbi:hypothetical protein JXB37_02325, partial [candidate division WOR-3 bacterium]|nr:hypothetical protein [candidate division WOR-3 bacterium]
TPSGDNEFTVQYLTANNYVSNTVGIQDPTGNVAIQCLFNGSYHRGSAPLVSGRAIKYATQDPTGVFEPNGGMETRARLEVRALANPFARRGLVAYAVPRSGIVTLAVFDPSGRRVRELASGLHPAGRYRVAWDGRDSGGRQLPAGVYWLRLDDGIGTSVGKAVKLH